MHLLGTICSQIMEWVIIPGKALSLINAYRPRCVGLSLAGNLRRKLGTKPLTTLADRDARTGGDPGN